MSISDKKTVVGVKHNFFDVDYVSDWVKRAAPTKERVELFSIILRELKSAVPAKGNIVELGIGPGYLASYLLENMPEITYYGIDFSKPMLDIAGKNLNKFSNRINLIRKDFLTHDWWPNISGKVDAVVSIWALHDLGGQDKTKSVYSISCKNIKAGGIFVNADIIKPENVDLEYEPGRFEVAKHIKYLREVGFKTAECIYESEVNIKGQGSIRQDHACIKAIA